MEIYKFGGASVKDAKGVLNVGNILKKKGYGDKVVIISAMGKTTNALEEVVKAYLEGSEELSDKVKFVKEYHLNIIDELFNDKWHPIYHRIEQIFEELNSFMKMNKSTRHSFVYDQIVGLGEIFSSVIVSYFLNEMGVENEWLDVRTVMKTDDFYRDANVDWENTQRLINEKISNKKVTITQGFLGSDPNNFTTTLGREGSDYTAAIFGYCLNAERVTIWKDVDGVLNADPRYFGQTKLLEEIPYQEAIELAFYGASVIHPKTLQPLKRKNIPLYVKSFLNMEGKGTCVCNVDRLNPKIPCLILKQNQNLISVSSKDFSFIEEENLSYIFNLLSKHKMKVSILQNSAISFSFCADNKYNNLEYLLEDLSCKFNVECVRDVKLYTVRHANDVVIREIEEGKKILLKQVLDKTVQIVTEK